jgi:hypothetical protein
MNTSSRLRRGGKPPLSAPLHPPLPRPEPRTLASLQLRLRAFGVAPTPDPGESWQHLRPLLRDHPITWLQRVRRRGLRGATGAAVALMLVTGVALAAEPVRLLAGSWVETWKDLARLAGMEPQVEAAAEASLPDDRGDRGGAGETVARVPEASQGTLDGTRFGGGESSKTVEGIPLVARNDTFETEEDVPVTLRVMANDVGPHRGVDVQADEPAHGTTTTNEDGTVTYTPATNFAGVDTFPYRVSNGASRTMWADVVVEVTPVNDMPTATDDKEVVDEDGSVVIHVLGNDEDVDGDELSVQPEAPASGTVDVNNDGTLTYKPASDFHGDDTFSYRLRDGKGEPATAKVEIEVRPVNDAPVATDDVLTDDNDVDGDPLTVTGAQAEHGDVAINDNGSLTYTPHPGYVGPDVISYAISDGAGGTAQAQVALRITSPSAGEAEREMSTAGEGGRESSGGG